MSWVLFTAVLAASSGGAQIKLAAPGLVAVNMADEVGGFYSDHFAHAMTLEGVRVVTARQIQTLLGYERQRQLLGCSQDSSCMAELANALGVDGLITGQIGRFEDIYQLDIKIISARTGTVLAAYSGRATGDKKLLDELTRAAKKLVPELKRVLQPVAVAPLKDTPVKVQVVVPVAPPPKLEEPPVEVVAPPPSHPDGLRRWFWVPAAAGGAVAIGGAVLMVQAHSMDMELRSPNTGISVAQAQSDRDQGPVLRAAGVTLVVLGALGVAAGGLMYGLGGERDNALTVVPTGAGVAVSGSFQ